MEAVDRKTSYRSKRRRGHKIVVLVVFVVLLLFGCRWLWRQVQFSRLRVPLIKAAEAGDTARVRDLLEQGADPDVRVDYKPEPFTWASVLRMLRGGNGSGSLQDLTVLMDAARNNREDIARLLLQHGAHVNSKDRSGQGWTALYYAASVGSIGCMKTLIAHGADVNAKDVNGTSPLFYAIFGDNYGEYRSSRQAGESGTALLLAHGADVNVQRGDGETPLMVAAEERSPACFHLLLDHKAAVNARDNKGATVLLWAATYRQPQMVQWLLQSGADIDARDKQGKTAVWYAVADAREARSGLSAGPEEIKRNRALLTLLLDRGANLQLKDKTGKTVLEFAATLHETEVLALLRKAAARASGEGKPAAH